MYFSQKEGSFQLNGFFLSTELMAMMEGKVYEILHFMLPFVFGYIEFWTLYADEAPLPEVHTQYSDLFNRPWSEKYSKRWPRQGAEKFEGPCLCVQTL